jgi:aryl-alcohol dehydrogenase-like predicted oxidoreductase
MLAPLIPPASPFLSPRAEGPARLVLGTMNFGKRTGAADAERIMARAIERGMTLFDTANVYNDGESERIVGRAIKGKRDGLLVATKVGLARVGNKPEGLSRAAVLAAVEGSLTRLGTDHIDLYYLHAPDHRTPIEETIDAIASLVQSGKIRHLGVSNFASWQVLEIIALCQERGIAGPPVSQVMYNLLIRQLDLEYFRFTARYRLHSTIYNPLAGGLLAGRYHPGDTIAPGSRFDKNKMYQKRYWSEATFALVERYRSLATSEGMSLLELAYAWLASAPGVDSILVGPASLEHLDAALDACAKAVSPALREKVQAIHEASLGTDASYAR